MSIDDPGWDQPGFDDGPTGDGWGEPAAPAPGSASGSSGGSAGGGNGGLPPWKNPRILGLAGGGLAVVVIVILIVVLLSGGGGSDGTAIGGPTIAPSTSAPTAPSTQPATTQPSNPPTKTTTHKIAPINAGESLADYDHKADLICRRFKPELKAADHEHNVAFYVRLGGRELQQLQSLKSPNDDASQTEQWINQASQAFEDLSADNIDGYNTVIVQADETAGQLGMKVCNYGH